MDDRILEDDEKTRVNFTVVGLYVKILDRLVKEGIFMNHGEIFRDSLRSTFRHYGMEPFCRKDREIEEETEKP